MEQYLAPAWGFHWHSSIGPNGSTGSVSRYRRPAKLGDDTALTGQSSQQWLASRGILSWKWRWSRPQPAPLSPPALLDQMGISLPGTSYLTGSWLSLMGVEPSPGLTGTPWEPEIFQGRGKYQPSGRYRPSTLVETGRCPTGQRPP